MDQEIILKWIEENGQIVDQFKFNKEDINLKIKSCNFEIIYPKTKNDYYIVNEPNNFDWLDEINISIIKKKLNLGDILDILKQYSNNVQINEHNNLDNFGLESSIDIDSYDIDFFKKKEQLENIMNNHVRYNKNTANLVIYEFLNTWKELKNNDYIDFDVHPTDLYIWKINIKKFNNNELNEKLKNNKFEIEIKVNDLFPNYPPRITVLKPKLNNLLAHKLSNMKMINLKYWSPTRNTISIINRILKLIEKSGDIDTTNNTKIEEYLLNFASCIDSLDDIDDQKYDETENVDFEKNQYIVNDNDYKIYNKVWNKDKYLESLYFRNEQLEISLENIICELEDKINYNNDIKNSYLIPFIKIKLESLVLSNIQEYDKTCSLIFKIIELLCTTDYVHILCENDIYNVIEKMYNMNKTYDIINIYNKLKPFYDEYKLEKDRREFEMKEKERIRKCSEDDYINELSIYKIDECQILGSSGCEYHYSKKYEDEKLYKNINKERFEKEFKLLIEKLPFSYTNSIFLMVEESNPSIMRALMTGPEGTPYDSGCYIFDIYIPNNYPFEPPNISFKSHSGKCINYYLTNDGKICIPQLSTLYSDNLSWNSKKSILSILLSIQNQIFSPQPYYNDKLNKNSNTLDSDKYNDEIKFYTMAYAIRDMLKNTELYPQFSETIKKHFKIKKDYIINMCEKWINELVENNKKEAYENVLIEIKTLFNNLN